MTDPAADSRHLLEKHHEYRTKARAASERNTRAAFEAVAREFLRRASRAVAPDAAPQQTAPKE